MEHSSFVAFVIFLTQIWSRSTVLLVSLGFLAPVECNRPAKFLLSSTVTIKSTRNSLKWYCSVPYAYGTYHTRIRIWYNHTRMFVAPHLLLTMPSLVLMGVIRLFATMRLGTSLLS